MAKTVTAFGAFTEQLRALCLNDFPGGLGSWNKTRFQPQKTKYPAVAYWEDENRPAGEENVDALKEFLTSSYSPWALEEIWSPEAQQLREVAVELPQLIDLTFIYSQFKSLRIIDKEVNEVDDNLLKFNNLEELILSANRIPTINAANLPRKLKVLELCGNEIVSLQDLCSHPPKDIQHLGLGYNCLSFPSESAYLTGDYWPNLLSLDLSFNNLTDLCGTVSKMITLKQLRILLLQGNPLSLLPWYQGYIIDSLPKLSILDDMVISTDGKLHFKGLSERQELLQHAALVVVSIGPVKGVPNPVFLEQEDIAEYPIITYHYYVTYGFMCEKINNEMDGTKHEKCKMENFIRKLLIVMLKHKTEAENENDSQAPENHSVALGSQPDSSAEEYRPKPPEGAREAADAHSSAMMNPQLKQAQLESPVTFYNTENSPWGEVIENSYRYEHVLEDLLGLKAHLLQGSTVAVIEEKTLYWPREEASRKSAKPQSAKKDGKGKEKEKPKEKGRESAKDKKSSAKQKKRKENLSDFRHDPPIRRMLGSFLMEMEKLLSGESLLTTVCDLGVPTAAATRMPAKDKDGKKNKDKKSKSGRESAASQKTTASSKGKGRGKGAVDVLPAEDVPPPPPVPLTVELQVQLVQWTSIPEAPKQEVSIA